MKNKMTNEELLQPRFKVIANFPDNTRNVGDIIYVENTKEKYWKENFEKWLFTFPHLFCKLEWWEDRKIEDLPKYLKDKFDIFEVENYYFKNNFLRFDYWDEETQTEMFDFVSDYEPATKEEYEANKTI